MLTQLKSCNDISKIFDCNSETVRNYLIKYNISIRSIKQAMKIKIYPNKLNLSKSFLIREYVDYEKPTAQIAKENNCCVRSIINYLNRYNIRLRSISESKSGKITKRVKNLVNKNFGFWLILERKKNSKSGQARWLCKCLKCHRKYIMLGSLLMTGKSEQCRHCAFKGEKNSFYGKKHSKKTINTIINSIANHHIYLKENSNETMKVAFKKHIKLHYQAYGYIYYRYGKKGIDNYIKWFDKEYGLK